VKKKHLKTKIVNNQKEELGFELPPVK
jgi:hypothetical protein